MEQSLLLLYSQLSMSLSKYATKSLSHIRSSLEGIVKSLEDHGLAQPVLGFTDNVASDAATFLQCIPSLSKNVIQVQLDEYSDLPRASLPSDITVHVCLTDGEIQSACASILEDISDDATVIHVGFDMEWEFSIGQSAFGGHKTALVQLAHSTAVYLLRVHLLKTLPSSLKTILTSPQIVKI